MQNAAFFPDSFHLIRGLYTKFSPRRTSKEIDVPPFFCAAQVVQGAPEPGGHQAAGSDGGMCPGIPGAFGQPAGKHADQDQSCW